MHATAMLRVADELFEEFDELPVLTVVQAMIHARTSLTGHPDGKADPSLVHAAARAELLAAGHRASAA